MFVRRAIAKTHACFTCGEDACAAPCRTGFVKSWRGDIDAVDIDIDRLGKLLFQETAKT